MVYLFVGTISGLTGLGLMMSGFKLIGIIVVLIGGAINLIGRRELDDYGHNTMNTTRPINLKIWILAILWALFYFAMGYPSTILAGGGIWMEALIGTTVIAIAPLLILVLVTALITCIRGRKRKNILGVN